MNSKGTLTANVCLTATTTALFAGTAWTQASASHPHKIKHGDTVELLSRHYHVPVREILAANHIGADDVLRDGRKLRIPDAHKAQTVAHTMRKSARLKGDRVSLRVGPSASHGRIHVYDGGAKITVTARHAGWMQVRTEDGRSGWVRSDYVHFKSDQGAAGKSHTAAAHRHDRAIALAHHARSVREASEIHRRQHAENVAHARKLAHLHELAARRRHGADLAHSGHQSRHQKVVHRLSEHQNEALANYLHRLRIKQARLNRHNAHHAAMASAAGRHKNHASVAHKRSEHDNEALANYLHRQQVKLARLHRHGVHVATARADTHHASHQRVAHRMSEHQNEALANYLHRQEMKLARLRRHNEHRSVIAWSSTHEASGEHRLSRHQNEALANYLHRQQVKMERRRRHEEVASTRHSGGHYSHHIRPEAESPTASNDVVRSAFAYRGTPYRWGMSRPGGFDCSGFTKYIYGRKGVALPRTAAEQYHAGHAVSHHNMKPGDLVFFHTTRSGISHVGMYVGNGKFVHSSSAKSGGVRVDNLDSGYYNKAFRGARRVAKETSEPSGE